MEAKSTLIRSQSGVELHTVAAIDLDLALVVFPYNAKLDDTFWDGGDFEGSLVFRFLLEEGGVLKGGRELYGEVSKPTRMAPVLEWELLDSDLCKLARTRARTEG